MRAEPRHLMDFTALAKLGEYSSLSELRSPISVGYLYHSTCSCGAVYVGMSERFQPLPVKNYMGSGQRWLKHRKANLDHSATKLILGWFSDPIELRHCEIELVLWAKKEFAESCFNLKSTLQGTPCESCGQFGRHKANCPHHAAARSISPPCEFCAGKAGHHKKICHLYRRELAICEECAVTAPGHMKYCSRAKSRCDECDAGSVNLHYKFCSHYKGRPLCEECGSGNWRHSKDCSNYKMTLCDECGSGSTHKAACSSSSTPGSAELF